MAAGILTLVFSVIVGGGAWLGLGSRLRLKDDTQQNDLLNLLSYSLIAFPVVFVVVFYLLENL